MLGTLSINRDVRPRPHWATIVAVLVAENGDYRQNGNYGR